jgi:hypothetical protein
MQQKRIEDLETRMDLMAHRMAAMDARMDDTDETLDELDNLAAEHIGLSTGVLIGIGDEVQLLNEWADGVDEWSKGVTDAHNKQVDINQGMKEFAAEVVGCLVEDSRRIEALKESMLTLLEGLIAEEAAKAEKAAAQAAADEATQEFVNFLMGGAPSTDEDDDLEEGMGTGVGQEAVPFAE